METFYRPKLTLLLLAIAEPTALGGLIENGMSFNGHRYSLMHDPIDFQEIE
ncbi:MAG: hypothetical protein ACRD5E_05690 [Nitrososphaeraceae archaeon]